MSPLSTRPEVKVVAEVGCNHKGDLALAKEMIKIAAVFAQVDVVKFQKRTPRELLTPEEYAAPHPEPRHSYGETYGAHREFLELGAEQHRELQACCEQWNVEYSTSVWDLTSAREIAALGPRRLKVPSACNQDQELLSWLCDQFPGEIHCSLGMTTRAEEERCVALFERHGRARDVVLYACTSGYPVPFEDIYLHEIVRLRESFGGRVKAIGFSGHHYGIAADVAALALGATWFERHFTLDRTWKGTDQAASLEPDGMRRVARDLRNVARSLAAKPQEILEIEAPHRKKLKRKVGA